MSGRVPKILSSSGRQTAVTRIRFSSRRLFTAFAVRPKRLANSPVRLGPEQAVFFDCPKPILSQSEPGQLSTTYANASCVPVQRSTDLGIGENCQQILLSHSQILWRTRHSRNAQKPSPTPHALQRSVELRRHLGVDHLCPAMHLPLWSRGTFVPSGVQNQQAAQTFFRRVSSSSVGRLIDSKV